jgi:hypothetical protein
VAFTSLGDRIQLKGKADGFEILTVDGYVTPHKEKSDSGNARG